MQDSIYRKLRDRIKECKKVENIKQSGRVVRLCRFEIIVD